MIPVVGVCDYGVGNLRSVERALLRSGAAVEVSADAGRLSGADGLILPGVGAFGTAMDALRRRGLAEMIIEYAAAGRPLLGVCLGFQVLFEWGEENGGHAGLALLGGTVTRIGTRGAGKRAAGLKVPHMGWNQIHLTRPSPLTDGLEEGRHMYFVHSYAARAEPADVAATCDHGEVITAVCHRASVMGTQFHPEKSGRDGLRIYESFVRLCRPQTAPDAPILAGSQPT